MHISVLYTYNQQQVNGSTHLAAVRFQCAAQAASTSGKGMRSQKEITLREELDQKDRVDIYRNFLLYCMSGNVINIGMGTSRTPPILLFWSLSGL